MCTNHVPILLLQSKLPDGSDTPIAQLLAFPQRYYEHTGYPPGCSGGHVAPHHPTSYTSGSQIHMPMYTRSERGFFERPNWYVS